MQSNAQKRENTWYVTGLKSRYSKDHEGTDTHCSVPRRRRCSTAHHRHHAFAYSAPARNRVVCPAESDENGFCRARAYREGTRLMASSCSIGGAASHKRAKLSLIVLAFLAEVDESSKMSLVSFVCGLCCECWSNCLSVWWYSEWRVRSTDRMRWGNFRFTVL